MIITLTGATFSTNIGTLSTWSISRVIGDHATYAGPTYVDKDAALSATITLDEGYEVGAAGVTVTMGGSAVEASSISGQVITISIASVTGNVVIKVPTVNSSTGEEDGGSEDEGDGSTTTGDVALTLSDYATYIGCIAGSTNIMQYSGKGSTSNGNMFYQIPLSDFSNPSSVTVVAGSSTKAYVSFFKSKAATNGVTPPYASGLTTQTIMEAGTTQDFTIPSDAVYMYILATNGTGSSLRPASVTFHGAVYTGCSDPAGSTDSGGSGDSSITTTTNQYFGVYWTLGQTVSASGGVTSQSTYALSNEIERPSGKNLKYTPYADDAMWLVIGQWNGDTWIERMTYDPAAYTSDTTITLDDNTTKIRLGYGRSSSTGISMTEEDLSHLTIEWV